MVQLNRRTAFANNNRDYVLATGAVDICYYVSKRGQGAKALFAKCLHKDATNDVDDACGCIS